MGYGKKLKEILDKKNMTVIDLSKATKINKSTIYTIIRNDANIRYDFALRIANALEIDINEICQTDTFITGETMPELPKLPKKDKKKQAIDYTKYRTSAIYALFDEKELPRVDMILSKFYSLTDEGRQDTLNFINALLKAKTDKKRETLVKKIL